MPSHSCRLIVFLTGVLSLSGCFLLGDRRGHDPLTYRSVATVAGNNERLGEPFGIATRDGEVYFSDGESCTIFKLDAEGRQQTVASGLNTPSAISFMPNGDLVVADTGSHTIRQISSDGTVSVLAGMEQRLG